MSLSLEEFLACLIAAPSYEKQISHIENIASRTGAHGSLSQPISERLQQTLENHGMWTLYSHQAQAIDSACRGEKVNISTPSASGKSLAYNFPVVED